MNVDTRKLPPSRLQKKRIALAEWMGWTCLRNASWEGCLWMPPAGDKSCAHLPDPFNDANADYAVLRCMRDLANALDDDTITPEQWECFATEVTHALDYRVGDYACAACKALDAP